MRRAVVGVLLWVLGIACGLAEDYPQRQIRIIVPFPAGAGPDQVARLIGQHLQDAFGEPVVVENRAG
ncbi:MAG: hypothetical protein JO365_35895, partial [Bradyrhizobium sp.]|nr:hypothetical protein [Bradyrhizobium sp.]